MDGQELTITSVLGERGDMQATVRIERYADQGRCIGHIDGRVVFVRFALPGELDEVVLDEPHERKDRFWTGEVVAVHEASAERVSPAWQLAGPLAQGGGVGGADLIHVSLAGQLAWKSKVVTEQLRRLGHCDVEDVPVDRIPGDEQSRGLHWRTRISLIADEEGRPSMRRRQSHHRVPIDTMPLASEAALAVANRAGLFDGGFEPGADIHLAVPEPRRQATVSASSSLHDAAEDGSAAVVSDRHEWRDRHESSLVDIGENYAVLVNGVVTAGRPLLHESVDVLGRRFDYTVRADGFWQVHRQAPLVLPRYVIDRVRALLDDRDHAVIWDLYSGAGLFTLPLARCTVGHPRLLSVEGSRPAVEQAVANLERAGVGDVEARTGDVAHVLRHVPKHLAHPDIVVLDPPRAGARADVCRRISASGAMGVVYVACDPTSLARDTATLTREGYTLRDVHAFDIYPMTHHVETVAVFVRGERGERR